MTCNKCTDLERQLDEIAFLLAMENRHQGIPQEIMRIIQDRNCANAQVRNHEHTMKEAARLIGFATNKTAADAANLLRGETDDG